MTSYRKLLPLIALWISATAHGADMTSRSDPATTWLERPWEIRYVLFVEDTESMRIGANVARKGNLQSEFNGRRKIYLESEGFFEPSAQYSVLKHFPLAVSLISFDRNGQVTSANLAKSRLTAKRNLMDDLVLITDAHPSGIPYYLAAWDQGIPGDAEFSPAVCAAPDKDRYRAGWDPDDFEGGFGCREWTVQLNHDPYINVTSYQKRGNFIGKFVGWSRFRDPPKPVIGLHGKTWLCLHECPDGEKPGVIPDIRKWTSKHGFPMPRRPHKQPEYPNSDFKADIEAERGD